MNILRTIIVPASRATHARQAAASASPAGSGMFISALVPADGPADAEPTHYISSGAIDEAFGAVLADPALVAQVGQISTEDAESLVSEAVVMDLADEGPHETIARLGLQLRQAPMEGEQ